MTKEEITEGNKLIADFMQLGGFDDGRYGWMWHNPTTKNGLCFSLEYHSSWNWLMPVVEKIENLEDGEYMFDICGRRSQISIMVNHNSNDNVTLAEFHTGNSNSKMEAVWLSVVEFIKCNEIK